MSSAPAHNVPDWNAVDRDVVCPLCDYNLRGLAEPRCPECGHEFNWPDLLSRPQPLRWLYEHRRGLAVFALIQTFLRGLSPGRFWTILRPAHAVNVRRLVLYVVVLLCIAAIGSWLPLFLAAMLRDAQRIPAVRAQLWARMVDHDGNVRASARPRFRTAEEVRQFIDDLAPSPFSGRGVLGPLWYAGSTWRPMQRLLAPILAWPIVTAGLLVAFRYAFGQPAVRIEHLLRVCVYCFDALLIGWALLLPLGHWVQPVILPLRWAAPFLFEAVGGFRAGSGGALVLIVLFFYAAGRFYAAYRHYLRWPHALRTTLLIQGFAFLTLIRLMQTLNADL